MTEFFRFTIEFKAQIHETPRGVGQNDIFERVQRLARRIIREKKEVTEIYKIIFIDLLLGDYYSNALYRKLKMKKEKEILLPVSAGLESQDKNFFEELFKEPLKEDLSRIKDNVSNLLFSQFGNPVITDARLIRDNEETNINIKGR